MESHVPYRATAGRGAPAVLVVVATAPDTTPRLESLLRAGGYGVQKIHAAEAPSGPGQEFGDVLLMDCSSDQSAVRAIERTRTAYPDSTVIVTGTSETEPEIVPVIARGGVQHFMTIPWIDEEMLAMVDQAITVGEHRREQRLRELLGSFTNVPMPEQNFSRLQGLLARPDCSIWQLVTEIEKNPALAAKVLQVANSVHIGTRQAVQSIAEAISLIGTRYISTMMTALEIVERMARAFTPEARLEYQRLWSLALHRAIVGRHIASFSGQMVRPEVAHVACLLQDVGLLIQLLKDGDRYREIWGSQWESPEALQGAEREAFRLSHEEIGAALLELWNFPGPMVAAIAHHHSATNGDILTQIMQTADCLVETAPPAHDPVVDSLVDFWRERLEGFGITESVPDRTAGTGRA